MVAVDTDGFSYFDHERKTDFLKILNKKKLVKVAYAFSAALFYGVCSGSMNFTNKWVLNTWGFNFPNFMVFCQLALFSAVITFLRYIGKITDSVVLAYTRERGSQLSVLSFLYLTNVILGIDQKMLHQVECNYIS